MLKEIVGMRPYDFKDSKTGEQIQGYNIYLQWAEDGVAGVCCESVSVSMKKLDGYDPALGDEVRVGYNRYGKVDFIIPA